MKFRCEFDELIVTDSFFYKDVVVDDVAPIGKCARTLTSGSDLVTFLSTGLSTVLSFFDTLHARRASSSNPEASHGERDAIEA